MNGAAFELLLSDIRMPVMDGIALAHAAARAHPAVTILLMTGYADQRERAAGLDALIHDVISKPFSLGAMRRAVNEALTAPPRRAAWRQVCIFARTFSTRHRRSGASDRAQI